MKRILNTIVIGGAGLLALAAWGASHTTPKTMSQIEGDREAVIQAGAMTLVTRRLKDPVSAKFDGVRYVRAPAGEAVCGLVNARNGFGGFTGWQVFVVTGEGVTINSAPTWRRFCA